MNQHRPERPPLATVICIIEVAGALLAALAHTPLRLWNVHYFGGHSVYHGQSFAFLALIAIGYLLALAGAAALWQMHRSAFRFFAARVALSLGLLFFSMPSILKRWPEAGDAVRVQELYFGILFITVSNLLLNALVTWYAYEVTNPEDDFAAYPR